MPSLLIFIIWPTLTESFMSATYVSFWVLNRLCFLFSTLFPLPTIKDPCLKSFYWSVDFQTIYISTSKLVESICNWNANFKGNFAKNLFLILFRVVIYDFMVAESHIRKKLRGLPWNYDHFICKPLHSLCHWNAEHMTPKNPKPLSCCGSDVVITIERRFILVK